MSNTITIITIVLCGLYILSPIDFIPEILVGPFGLVDDFIAGAFATSVGVLWNKRKKTPPVLKEPANWEMGQNCPPILKSEPPILLN